MKVFRVINIKRLNSEVGMTDFCITSVRYNKEKSHIEFVKVREEKEGKVGAPRIVSRAFVADLIRLRKASFQTRVKNSNNKWSLGSSVHLIDGEYLTTDKNNTKLDNLGNLPEF